MTSINMQLSEINVSNPNTQIAQFPELEYINGIFVAVLSVFGFNPDPYRKYFMRLYKNTGNLPRYMVQLVSTLSSKLCLFVTAKQEVLLSYTHLWLN
jgi:hypothetical protein